MALVWSMKVSPFCHDQCHTDSAAMDPKAGPFDSVNSSLKGAVTCQLNSQLVQQEDHVPAIDTQGLVSGFFGGSQWALAGFPHKNSCIASQESRVLILGSMSCQFSGELSAATQMGLGENSSCSWLSLFNMMDLGICSKFTTDTDL